MMPLTRADRAASIKMTRSRYSECAKEGYVESFLEIVEASLEKPCVLSFRHPHYLAIPPRGIAVTCAIVAGIGCASSTFGVCVRG